MLFYEKPKNGNVFVALKKKIQTRIELVITGSPHAIKKMVLSVFLPRPLLFYQFPATVDHLLKG